MGKLHFGPCGNVKKNKQFQAHKQPLGNSVTNVLQPINKATTRLLDTPISQQQMSQTGGWEHGFIFLNQLLLSLVLLLNYTVYSHYTHKKQFVDTVFWPKY